MAGHCADSMHPSLRPRLFQALSALSQALRLSENINIIQVWFPAANQAGIDALQKQLYADVDLCVMGSQALMPFRLSSCQCMQFGHQGMPGRVLRSGCVQVVQNLRIIPEVLHPRCRLPEPLAGAVGEVLYIPVYDQLAPHAGPLAVMEALLSATATDSMLVANFISVAGNVLSCLQLSLSNPLPQPVRRSKLEGRKPRPIHTSSSQDLTAVASSAQQQQQQQQQSAPQQVSHPAATVAVPSAVPHPAMQGVAAACTPAVATTAAAGATAAGCSAFADCAQQQLTSCSSGSAGTIVGGVSAGSPTSSPIENALSSSLSSCLQDNSCCMGTGPEPAASAARQAGGVAAGEPPELQAATGMLPPRPCGPAAVAASAARVQHRRRWQQDGGGDLEAAGAAGSTLDVDLDSSMSPPPAKLRRTVSMVRTKSVPMGLDQALLEAMAVSEPAF